MQTLPSADSERSFRERREAEINFPNISQKFASKFALIFLMLCLTGRKVFPKISPELSHRIFQISNQISPKNLGILAPSRGQNAQKPVWPLYLEGGRIPDQTLQNKGIARGSVKNHNKGGCKHLFTFVQTISDNFRTSLRQTMTFCTCDRTSHKNRHQTPRHTTDDIVRQCTTICDIFCPVPFLLSRLGFHRFAAKTTSLRAFP